ncbi:MAG: SEC-C domain-containing protein [Syntrophaceae bacterium]|nr:SEC-C domain-containing protein [Syntrophaceae bacterium]
MERNEQCRCGSGKKFKKCHLHWAEEKLRELKEEDARLEPMEMNRYAITMERRSESAIRRFLTSKDMISLFQQLKEKALESIKAPDKEFKSKGFMSYFEPIFSQITFESKEELEDFTKHFMEYYNALAHQFLHHPRNEKLIH